MPPDRRRRGADAPPETKVCPVCGLPFSNRKKWASRGLWPSIVYCSERCRRRAAAARRDGAD